MVCRSSQAVYRCPIGAVLGALAVLVSVLLASAPASASGICVQCEAPAQTYQCLLPEGVRVSGNELARRGATLACIQFLAREKGHERCSVRRGTQGACIGDPVVLGAEFFSARRAAGTDGTDLETQSEAGDVVPGPDAAEAPPRPDDSEPPRTVVDMARRAADSTNRTLERTAETLEDTGSAVGGAIQRSWTCLVTLFNDCQ